VEIFISHCPRIEPWSFDITAFRLTIRPSLLYKQREKHGPEWYGLDNVVNLLVWPHFQSTKPLFEISLQFTLFLFEFSYSLHIYPGRILGLSKEISEAMFVDL
jgi:hypothetical protein